VLAALATRFSGPLAVLRKVSAVVLCPAAAMTVLATLAASRCRPLAISGEIARAALPTSMTGTGRFLAVFGKIARVTGMMLFRHVNCSFKRDGTCPSQLTRPRGGLVVFTITVRRTKLCSCGRHTLAAEQQQRRDAPCGVCRRKQFADHRIIPLKSRPKKVARTNNPASPRTSRKTQHCDELAPRPAHHDAQPADAIRQPSPELPADKSASE
jgi:hypothetical protein